MAAYSLRKFFWSLALIFGISAAALSYLLFKASPLGNAWVLFAFYLSVFFLLFSAFTLSAYVLRVLFSHNSPLETFARMSLRQGILIGALSVVLLVLQSMRAFTLLSVSLLVISLVLLEIAFLTR